MNLTLYFIICVENDSASMIKVVSLIRCYIFSWINHSFYLASLIIFNIDVGYSRATV